MDIIIELGNKILIKCAYGFLEPYAPTTSRKFSFEKVTFVDSSLSSLYGYEIEILISVNVKENRLTPLYEFKIYVLDHQDLNGDNWWVSGLIINEFNKEYRQGVVDVFDSWENKKDFDWSGLPLNSILKKDYISACLIYSGIRNEIMERDYYSFDMKLIKEERDFFYLAGKEFIGEKGYFGHNFHAFKDCLLTVFDQSGYFSNKKVVFKNVKSISENALLDFYKDVKDVFVDYKFIVEEK